MRNSILLRRIILLLLSAVILSGLLSASIYIFVTQRMYVQTRAEELMPIAQTIADMITDMPQYGTGERSLGPLLDHNNKNFLGALLHVFDASSNDITNPPKDGGKGKMSPADEVGLTEVISGALAAILTGSEVSEIRTDHDGHSYLVVGVPIRDDASVVGAVIFTKDMDELNGTMRGMNLTLLASTLIAFLVMLIPGYFLTRRLVVPIRQMETVARAMSEGDFTVRADESQKGEIGKLACSMNHFAVESGRLEQIRRDYVANVSHELRTPIAAIRAMGETLRDGMAKSPDKQQLFYNNIVRESLRLSRLVDDLLELSRLQSAVEPIKKTHFDLCEVIQHVADIYSHVASEAGIRFVLAADIAKTLPVFSNPDRLEQVMIILLDNAIKHTPENGTITLSADDKDDFVEIAISDTGEGIPTEDIPHIFERFYTVDKAHSGNGTGLGLSLAHEIVKGLGEHIHVESHSKNTVFLVTVHK